MKVALCLFGKLGNKITKSLKNLPSETISPEICAPYQLKALSKAEQIDIFVHSWSENFKNEILKTYKPKLFEIEKFILTDEINRSLLKVLKKRSLISKVKDQIKQRLPFEYFQKGTSDYVKAIGAQCRWISTYKSIQLMKKYSELNAFKYDFVLSSRFDSLFFSEFNLKKLDQNSIYASFWNNVSWPKPMQPEYDLSNNNQGKGLLDLWFLGSQRIMVSFAEIANLQHLYHLNPHLSSYEHIKRSNINLKNIFFRGPDHEIARRALFDAKE